MHLLLATARILRGLKSQLPRINCGSGTQAQATTLTFLNHTPGWNLGGKWVPVRAPECQGSLFEEK